MFYTNFRIFISMRNTLYYNTILLLEILNKDFAHNLLKDNNKLQYYDKILDIDPTKDKNAVYSVNLTKLFLQPHSQSDDQFLKDLESYFKKYIAFKNRKLIKGPEADFNKIQTFKQFHELVDKIEASLIKTKSKDYTKSLTGDIEDSGNTIEALGKKIDKKDITYIDSNVIVIRADNSSKSKHYGGGFSNWCTAKKSGNYFYQYRLGQYGGDGPQTMYYVYFLSDKNKTKDEMVLHFGVEEDGDISYTDMLNDEKPRTLRWLIKKFPELKVAYNNDAFKFIPLSSIERKTAELENEIEDEEFDRLSYEEREMYLLSGERKLTLRQFEELAEELKNIYLYEFENRDDDIDGEIFNKIISTKFGRVYCLALKRRILDDFDEERRELTEHETWIFDFLVGVNKEYEELKKIIPKFIGKDIIIQQIKSSPNRQETINRIIDNNKELDYCLIKLIRTLIDNSTNKQETIDKIINSNKKIDEYSIIPLINNSINKQDIIDKFFNIISNNLELDLELDLEIIEILIHNSINKQDTIDKIINSNRELDYNAIGVLINNSISTQDTIDKLRARGYLKESHQNYRSYFK